MGKLTHFNAEGNVHMVNVGDKDITRRTAVADGFISMQTATLVLICEGGHKKGDVLGIARIAGIMAAKKTSDLIPLCHPLPLTHLDVVLEADRENDRVYCKVTAQTDGKTGVEMEALTAVQIALLTIYDMCKSVDRGMCIHDVQLLSKAGGKSGDWQRDSNK